MAEPIKCPPEQPTFFGGIVYPNETRDELLALRANVLVFDQDVQLAAKTQATPELQAYAKGWQAWRDTVLAFVADHDTAFKNLGSESEAMYRGRVYLCELQDFRAKFRTLGGKPVSPDPSDPGGSEPPKPVQDTLSKATLLIAVAAGAFLIYQLIPKRR